MKNELRTSVREKIGGKMFATVYRRRFDSWQGFVEYASDCNGRKASEPGRTSHDQSRSEWAGSKSFTAAAKLASNGWPERRPDVEAITSAIKDEIRPLMVDTFASHHDVEGSFVDVSAFLAGEPENMIWMEPVRISKPGRVIGIVCSGSASAGVSTDDIVKKGAAVAGLVETLELLQHNTEVWIDFTVRNYDKDLHSMIIKVKGADEKLDIDQLLFALAHPSSLRRICFAAQEAESLEIRQNFGFDGGYYGMPHDPIMDTEVGATVTLPAQKLWDEPEKWVRKYLAEFGLLTD